MFYFNKVKQVKIPQGYVQNIRADGKSLWHRADVEPAFRYVSLGDSIAAGHAIDFNWQYEYGEGSQFGENGNRQTRIVSGCYTDLIHQDLVAEYGAVSTKSFARSGDQVSHLIEKLDQQVVRGAIANADLVTVCIGANDVLTPALNQIPDYLTTGSLGTLEIQVQTNVNKLANDSDTASYRALFNKLYNINPNAQYVFTTIYSPYKYLWLDEGQGGFFKPALDAIPQMTILGFEVDEYIKSGLLNTPAVKNLFTRVNGIHDFSNRFVDKLNNVLKQKIITQQGKFAFAETKDVFDTVPDRPISAEKHYNNLVNVEFTRGYTTYTMDWDALYYDENGHKVNPTNYWLDLAWQYTSTSGVDINGLAEDLAEQTLNKVIMPNIDPHPEAYGHHALRCSFEDAMGWKLLKRRTITYNANYGTNKSEKQTVIVLDNLVPFTNIKTSTFTHPTDGYRFTGWNTSTDGSGTTYLNNQLIEVPSNLTLYAQWSNLYSLTLQKDMTINAYDSLKYTGRTPENETGKQDLYLCWVLNNEGGMVEDITPFGKFTNGSNPTTIRTIPNVPYGTIIRVIVTYDSGQDNAFSNVEITYNDGAIDEQVLEHLKYYDFPITADTTIVYEWNLTGVAYISGKSWWDCHIKTR
jgi:uncharacterized repeat protein (TIGR02543 family)